MQAPISFMSYENYNETPTVHLLYPMSSGSMRPDPVHCIMPQCSECYFPEDWPSQRCLQLTVQMKDVSTVTARITGLSTLVKIEERGRVRICDGLQGSN